MLYAYPGGTNRNPYIEIHYMALLHDGYSLKSITLSPLQYYAFEYLV